MTNTEHEPADVDEAAATKDVKIDVSPTGNWEPNTPPPVAPPTGNWEPNTPPPVVTPTGNWEPNTPPVVTPMGNWEPNTPPPGPTGTPAAAPAQATGAWVYGRRITNLFSSSGNPGVWAWVPGTGWRRLAGSENGRGPLTTLALLAKTNGLAVTFHEDAAGQIDQLLV